MDKRRNNYGTRYIYIIDDDESSILVFNELFKEDIEYKFISVKSDMIDVALKKYTFYDYYK